MHAYPKLHWEPFHIPQTSEQHSPWDGKGQPCGMVQTNPPIPRSPLHRLGHLWNSITSSSWASLPTKWGLKISPQWDGLGIVWDHVYASGV